VTDQSPRPDPEFDVGVFGKGVGSGSPEGPAGRQVVFASWRVPVPGRRFTRRQILATTGAAAAGLSTPFPAAGAPAPPEEFPRDGDAALEQLKAGNARFAEGKTRHAHEGADWRKHLVDRQKPFATILGCSDSRVPVELVFDQGFGDLFVVRVAGNVIADDVVGSIAYAALHLSTPLFVVLGHVGCGAVTAALDARLKKAKEPERIEALVKLIDPGLKDLDLKLAYPALLDAAVEANVRWSLRQLTDLPDARLAVRRHRCVFAGAVYDLQTGTARFLR
jgi:carbonic anhydrase